MATLTGQQIDGSYQGLIKTTDNGAISGTAKAVTDGLGNATNIEISNTSTNFVSGTVDFTGSTVSGLPTSTPGLISGSGSDSMESDPSLTTVAANASGADSIALGDSSVASATGSVALGEGVTAATANTVSVKALETQTDGGVQIKGDGTNAGKLKLYCEDASGAHNVTLEGPAHAGGATYSLKFPNVQSAGTQILEADASGNLAWINTPSGGGGAAGLVNGTGTDTLKSAAALTTTAAVASGNYSIALGEGASATRQESVAIGQNATANGSGSEGSIAIGAGSVASANRGIAIGINGTTNSSEGIVIGDNVDISGSDRSVGIGNSINLSGGSDKVAIGTSASVTGTRGLAFGQNASATASEAIAIGYNVTAANASTLSVKALETQTDSTPTAGGIIMSDAGGTDRRLNIDADGNLQVDSNLTNKAFSVGRYSGISTDFSCDTIQSTVLIPGGTFKAGDILQFNGMEQGAGGTGWCYTAFWLSTSGTIGTGGTETMNICQTQTSSADWKSGYQKTIYVHTADGTGAGSTIWPGGSASDVYNSGVVSGGDAIQTKAVDWTNDIYLVSRICIDNTGTTYTNHGGVIRKIN